jgi:hypothetical protein
MALVGLDAAHTLPEIPGWREPGFVEYYHRQRWPPYIVNDAPETLAADIFREQVSSRPARIDPQGLVRWSGYLDGRYYLRDLTPLVLNAATIAVTEPVYRHYMMLPWTPLLIDAPQAAHMPIDVTPADIALRLAGTGDATGVRQIEYGVNTIRYEVTLSEPRVLVENEIYFPGWRATLSIPGTPFLDALAVNGVFRGWRLPAGVYSLVATFEFPYGSALRIIAVISLVLYACVLWRWQRCLPLRSVRRLSVRRR